MQNLAIVTGAAGGIGRAIVEKCLREGWSVIACDKNLKAFKKIKHKHLYFYSVDVKDFSKVTKFFKWIKSRKLRPNHLINNAGIYLAKKLSDYSKKEIDHILGVNLLGAIYFSQQFGKLLMKRKVKGAIVNMSSVSALEGSSDAIYGISKAGLIGLTKSCAMSFAPYVRVNALAPGVVDTPMLKMIPKWRLKEYRKAELIRDSIQPRDIANSAWFLLSDAGSHYTGTVLDINNGCYIRA